MANKVVIGEAELLSREIKATVQDHIASPRFRVAIYEETIAMSLANGMSEGAIRTVVEKERRILSSSNNEAELQLLDQALSHALR